MELKIRIKETKLELRGLTREEWFARKIPLKEQKVREFLDEVGYVYTTHRYDGGEYGSALFRKETIRDATPLEGAAWHHLQQCKYCDGCKVMDGKRTKECIFCGIAPCPSFSGTKQAAEKLLEGKEIILELVE